MSSSVPIRRSRPLEITVTSKSAAREKAASDVDQTAAPADASADLANEAKQAPRRRGRKTPRRKRRSIPAAVRRAVWERDQSRCTYVDSRGQRCRETSFLELDHEHPDARGGPPTLGNLRLRCRVHNALAAEQIFGRAFMESKKGSPNASRHQEPP